MCQHQYERYSKQLPQPDHHQCESVPKAPYRIPVDAQLTYWHTRRPIGDEPFGGRSYIEHTKLKNKPVGALHSRDGL